MDILVKQYGKIKSAPFAKGWRLVYVPERKQYVLVQGCSTSSSITYHWFSKKEITKLGRHIERMGGVSPITKEKPISIKRRYNADT